MQIETFQSNEVELKSQQRILRDKFTEIKHDAQREIAKMSEDRRGVFQQLERSREEYDYLKAIQSSSVTDYQTQLADLKQVHTYVRTLADLYTQLAGIRFLHALDP